jgi:hypothetical protein
MHFATTQKLHTSEDSYVQLSSGTRIKLSAIQRWLELWFDRNFIWKHHMHAKLVSTMRVIILVSQLGNTGWGLSQFTLRQLYQSCISTVADFTAEVW